jgi:hypothetical protein
MLYRTYSFPWEKIEPCPEKPVEITAYSNFSLSSEIIYVKTDTQSLYSYERAYQKPDIWKKIEAIPNESISAYYLEGVKRYKTPDTPGKVIDNLDVLIQGPDYSLQVDYILIEDGTLWRWDRMTSALDITVFFVIGIVGAIASFLSSLTLLIKRANKNTW